MLAGRALFIPLGMKENMPSTESSDSSSKDVLAVLRRLAIIEPGIDPDLTALSGGVASDIWRIETASGPVCVKRALEKLKVEADWRVPVERNANEVAWMEFARELVPGAVPALRGHDRTAGLFVMDYLDPATHPVWKDELRAGRADPAFAAQVGDALGRIHAGTAGNEAIAARIQSDDIFYAIRLESYLEATARAHPELGPVLRELIKVTAQTKLALVHGDVSPKNILAGPEGPVFLDAECAWYGDPAFDVAFCLNHMLLKCLWVPDHAAAFLACFDALAEAHRRHVNWEPQEEFEKRTARLLPGLFLARADGKSPAEYLGDDDKTRIRGMAGAWLSHPPARLAEIRAQWSDEVSR